MTLHELQRYVRHLSNGAWVRYWCHLNHPQNPAKMAIQVLDCKSANQWEPVQVKDLEKLGFKVEECKSGAKWIYSIERTNEDGSLFVSRL